MGCTGSKYETLTPETSQGSSQAEGEEGPSDVGRADAAPTTPQGRTAPASELSPATTSPGDSVASEPAIVPPWSNDSCGPLASGATTPAAADSRTNEPPPPEPSQPPLPGSEERQDFTPSTPASSSSAIPRPMSLPEEKVANTTFDNTIIIFDWDDTLLCSSALHCCLPHQFNELEEIVESCLLLSMSLGRTIIVTNAMESWIQETTRRFMPRLLPLLERLLIVYARKNWERLWPGDTFAWKRESFRELLNDKSGLDLNMLVLGDSLSEIRAAEALSQFLGSAALIKTVKFKAMPSPSDLLGELRTIVPELPSLIEERHSASKELYQEVPSGGLFNPSVFKAAPNWQLLDSVPNEMFSPPPGVFANQHLWSVIPPPPPAAAATTQITI